MPRTFRKNAVTIQEQIAVRKTIPDIQKTNRIKNISPLHAKIRRAALPAYCAIPL
jgi:hypothetical protein